MIGFSYSSKPVGFRAISMPFWISWVKKYTPVNFQTLFETDVIKEKVGFKISAEATKKIL